MKQFITLFIFITFLSACSNTKKPEKSQKANPEDEIYCHAIIRHPNEFVVSVAPAIKGHIKKIYFKNGDSIRKGDLILTLSNPEYLDIQKEYLSRKHELEYLREDFKRQGELTIENVSSLKKMQKSQSDFLSKEKICQSLEKKLAQIGINPSYIYKNGPIDDACVFSPSSGSIKTENLTKGQMLDPNDEKIKIISNNSLIATLFIDPGDYLKIEKDNHLHLFTFDSILTEIKILPHTIIADGNFIEFDSEIINPPSYFLDGLKIKAILKK